MIDKLKSNKIQILRALSIIAVVLIHTCPSDKYQFIFRPFINFGVATFLFLSGYLTKFDKINYKQLYKKRIIKVLIPYIVYTIIYTSIDFIFNGIDFKKIIMNLITTKSAAHMYYIFIYIEFVLLTPLIEKISKSKYYWLAYLISPIFIFIFKYVPLIFNIEIKSSIQTIQNICCLTWFIFYYYGLLVGNNLIKHKILKYKMNIVLYIISLLIQIIEGYILYLLGDINCGTQIKLSTLFTNIIFTNLIINFIETKKINKNIRILTLIGNDSFGIYFIHMLIIYLAKKIEYYSYIPYVINSFLIVFLCIIIIELLKKILQNNIQKMFGL